MKQVAVPRGPPSFLQKFDYTFYFLCHQTKEVYFLLVFFNFLKILIFGEKFFF
jgi:hypothetical protein